MAERGRSGANAQSHPQVRVYRGIAVTNWGGASTGTVTLDAPGLLIADPEHSLA
jgi:hypothetical protein